MRTGLSKVAFVLLATQLLCAAAKPTSPTWASPAATAASNEVVAAPQRPPAHVMVIVEENRNRGEVIGASNMPYFNSLAVNYGNTTAWNGVSHPSLPNYLALASGSTQGVTEDECGPSFPGVPTIGSQLSAAGIAWKAYMEELPEPASEVCTFGGYAKKHNPFAYFPETNGPNVVPATQFWTDKSSGRLPAFIFFVPNLTNDGHVGTNEQVDNYLKSLIPQLLASTWYQEGGIIIITWDESNGEGRIPTIVLSGKGSGKVLTTVGNHYGTLATIEDLYGLPLLGNAAGAATLTPLFAPHWYRNGVRLPEDASGTPVIAWGTLTLANANLGALRCHTVAAGAIENPTDGGAGKDRLLALIAYNCTAPACEAAGGRLEVVPQRLGWSAVLVQESGVFHDKFEDVGLRVTCRATALNVEFHGALNPQATNGLGIGILPSKLAFNAASGSLESTSGAGEVTGKLKLMGSEGQELIQVKNP
jgi:phosphatidylinositol-3-phosphatase